MSTTPRNAKYGPPRNDSQDFNQNPSPTYDANHDVVPDSQIAHPGYVADPNLAVIWGGAPNITGDVGDSNQSGGSVRSHPAYSVNLGSIRDAENTMLGAERTAVDAYMHLKDVVKAAIDGGTVFGQQAMVSNLDSPDEYNAADMGITTLDAAAPTADQAVQDAANQYAAVMNPAMSGVLREIADAIENSGRFTAMLNRAGQLYAHADKSSFFPDPPPTAAVKV